MQIFMRQLIHTVHTLCHIRADHLKVNPCQVRVMLSQDLLGPLDLVIDLLDRAGLEFQWTLIGIAMDWVRDPDHVEPSIVNTGNNRREQSVDLISHAHDQDELAHLIVRIEDLDCPDYFLRVFAWTNLVANRVADSSEKLYMGLVKMSCSLANPQKLC